MTKLFIEDYRVNEILCIHKDAPEGYFYISQPPWEMLYLDATCSKNWPLISRMHKAKKDKSELTIKLVLEDSTYAFFVTVECLFFEIVSEVETFKLALHLCQEICKNDAGEICFRAITAPGHTAGMI